MSHHRRTTGGDGWAKRHAGDSTACPQGRHQHYRAARPRHTAATHLIAGGIDVTTTAAILGHSTPTVTLSIYLHVVEGNESAALDVIGDRLEAMRSRIVDALENSNGYRGRFGKEKSPCYRAFNGCGDRI